jgi:hypothetical protein
MVTERDELVGKIKAVSRLPQYLTTAMLTAFEQFESYPFERVGKTYELCTLLLPFRAKHRES